MARWGLCARRRCMRHACRHGRSLACRAHPPAFLRLMCCRSAAQRRRSRPLAQVASASPAPARCAVASALPPPVLRSQRAFARVGLCSSAGPARRLRVAQAHCCAFFVAVSALHVRAASPGFRARRRYPHLGLSWIYSTRCAPCHCTSGGEPVKPTRGLTEPPPLEERRARQQQGRPRIFRATCVLRKEVNT